MPVTITNARGKNAVLLSEDDWRAIEETLYLNAIPKMTESILAAARLIKKLEKYGLFS